MTPGEVVVDLRATKAALRALDGSTPERLFAMTLADYMNDELWPEAIGLATQLLISDLARGKSGWAGVVLPRSLTQLPPVAYAILRLGLAQTLADAGAPAEVVAAARAAR